jgi:hypothetical protein
VNTESGLEGHLQPQAGSPAQNNRSAEGEQLNLAPGEQLMQASGGEPGGKQLESHWSKQYPPVAGEVKLSRQEPQAAPSLERLPIGGEQTEDHNGEQLSKVMGEGEQIREEQIGRLWGGQSENEQFSGEQVEQLEGEQTMGEQTADQATLSDSDKQLPDEDYSRWLRSMMPDASNGWWDVRVKGTRFTAKFRWRGPDLQVISLLHISREEIEILKQSSYKDVQRRIQDQIAVRLQSFLLDSAKRDKAITAAEKLGITIENFQLRKIEN